MRKYVHVLWQEYRSEKEYHNVLIGLYSSEEKALKEKKLMEVAQEDTNYSYHVEDVEVE